MSILAIFCPVSEHAAGLALANAEVADALALPVPTLESAPYEPALGGTIENRNQRVRQAWKVLEAAGIGHDEVLEKRVVAFDGVRALGLGWVFEQGAPAGSDAGHGMPRVLSVADADRALLAVRDVTWSGGDDLRADLEDVFSLAVEHRFALLAAIR